MDETGDARESAIKRLKAKSDFRTSLIAYVLVNSFLVVVWVLGDGGTFWPIFPIAGWGLGLAFQAWNAYGLRPVSEADIRREMERGD
jgi:hypothetical protein